MATEVYKISTKRDLKKAFKIRHSVFVDGQNVPPEEEFDQYEDESHHFLAKYNDVPCGTARWRLTAAGIKLERFAVLKNYRGRLIGYALVGAVLKDIETHKAHKDRPLYLHSQIAAMPLYKKFGFELEGVMFYECNIAHMKMVKNR